MADTVSRTGLDSNMLLSESLQIVAAGPVVSCDCGMLGTTFLRAVLRLSHGYVVSIQTVDANGEHLGYDAVADRTTDDYRAALKYFRSMLVVVDSFGVGYHNHD